MNAVKYYVSGALFVLLCLLDAFFALMLIASFSEGAKAKPFGLAGLQYIESKIKV